MKLRRQLLLVSLFALALPWAGCQYLRQVDSALSQGQMQALEATASAVAARLASAPRLIAPDTARPGRPPGAQFYLHPLPQPPLLDGYGDDWRAWRLPPRELSGADGQPLAQVTMGRAGDRVYLLLTVADDSPAYHDPRTGLVASGDAVEIHTGGRHYTLPVASQGNASAVWRDARRGAARRDLRLRGRWTTSADGYQLELVLPYGLTDGEFAIAVIDRATSDGGPPERRASTLPADGRPGRLVQPLPALQEELEHFARPHLQLVVVDQEGYRLASTGARDSGEALARQHWLRNWVHRQLLAGSPLPSIPAGGLGPALARGRETVQQWYRGPRETRIGAASVPVITRADAIVERPLLGRVIALQSGDSLQELTQSAAYQLWLVSSAAAGGALLLLLGYASWLSWRIRRLHRAARNAVDASGRLRGDFPRARMNDELGALNRAFASLLQELDQYHQYLRTLASKLSHELRTPLAVVRGSLDNLSAGELDPDSRRYAERALEGSSRLSGILNSLAAASHLEASIRRAEEEPAERNREEFDLADLLQVLAESYRDAHPGYRFTLDRPHGPQAYCGAPELLAQLLDKLADNAVSFAPEDSEIRLRLERVASGYRISVSNDGPLLPRGFTHKLFDSLVSVREDAGRAGHLGLGLHIARLIADFHGGRLEAADRPDGSGVVFTLHLPVNPGGASGRREGQNS
ncbi:ATP-binding protein [Microbulbifer yueqingensis]|uniref:histidine kinase n=1 Tax=Microbulbifer yueqingensis TaxID=658219 RepID=A0A1G9EV04_9GAMM|nr:ATP-binding protein [Microbulbifer yueqingensis]SDK79868.1 dedicated sortase system histidine kinase [Microbulbifer yueqingensis]